MKKVVVLNLNLFMIGLSLLIIGCTKDNDDPSNNNHPKTETFIDNRDGRTYKYLKISNQYWMAENLAYLPSVSHSSLSSDTAVYYVYNFNDTNVSAAKVTNQYQTYGVLYNWSAAMNGDSSSNSNPSEIKGACPVGWHLPSDDEWKELEKYLGMSQSEADTSDYRGTTEGGKLKEVGLSHWKSPNTGATNSSGFSALPGGYRNNIEFLFSSEGAYFWSSTESQSLSAWNRILSTAVENIYRFKGNKKFGLSIRCVKD